MKAFIVLLLCAAAAVHATIDADDFDHKVQQFSKECLREMHLDPGLMNNNDSKVKRPSNTELNCYIACVDKKLGMMSQDGTYDKEAILNLVTPEKARDHEPRVEEILQNCKSQVGNDYCRMAACIHRMPPSQWKYVN